MRNIKADLLSGYCDSKQYRGFRDLQFICHPCDLPRYHLSVRLGPLWWHWHIWLVSSFSRTYFWPQSQCNVSAASSCGKFTCLLETGQCHPNSERTIFLRCCQLPADFHYTSFITSAVGSSRTIYEMHCCASTHPACLSERSGHMW